MPDAPRRAKTLLRAADERKRGAQTLVAWQTPELVPSARFGRVIPVCEPLLAGNEERYVLECVRSSWISSKGAFLERFEAAFARYCGVRHAMACSSGTAALHLALHALDVGPGDEVIVPTFTIASCANMVHALGATPVFADVDPRTYTLDPRAAEALITPRTRALMGVHLYGHPCDMSALRALADAYGLWLLEDAAEAFGAEVDGRRAGSLGDVGVFSLYGNKIVTTGEGGMIVTDNDEMAAIVRELRDLGFYRPTHFWHRRQGFVSRLTNLQAAVGLAQIERADELVARREAIAARYDALLADVPGLVRPPRTPGTRNVCWMYALRIEEEAFGASRDRVMRSLGRRGIETKTFFIPLHLQPIYYRDAYEGRFPVAERIATQGLYLPSGPALTDEEIVYVAESLRETAREASMIESAP